MPEHWLTAGSFGLRGFVADLYARTKRAWLYWCNWNDANRRAFQRIGTEPPVVQQERDLCKVCFGSFVYTRKGLKDRWMTGIALCARCHAPHLIRKALDDGDEEKEDKGLTIREQVEKIDEILKSW